MTTDSFITSKPNVLSLQKYIAFYYFHFSDDPTFKKTFQYYPNYRHALTAYIGSSSVYQDNTSRIIKESDSYVSTYYSVNYQKNIKVILSGKFFKVGVVFHPLGINHFIKNPLEEIFCKDNLLFDYFGEELAFVLKKVRIASELNSRVDLLDAFFESKFINFNQSILKKAIEEIINTNGTIRVNELSDKMCTTRKTLLRLFKKHTLLSVEEYKKMVMFREAFNFYQLNKENINLTDLAIYCMYYDQAHFIKHFKSVTQESPSSLLDKIVAVGDENTYWYFED